MNADKTRSGWFGLSAACGMVLAGLVKAPVYGAGLWLYEQGVPDMGMANAGRAALAENAATAAGNPAGMTRLDRSEALAGIQPMFFTTKFDRDSSSFGGGNGDNAGAFIPAGGFHYVHDLSPRLKLGFSTASFFGAGLDYSNDWAGRYYVTEAVMFTAQGGPSLGYRINDQWSLGAGAFAMYADLTQKARLNNAALDPGTPDGSMRLNANDLSFGGRLGVLFEPTSTTRFGLQYSTKVELKFEDDVRLNNSEGWEIGIGPNITVVDEGLAKSLTTTTAKDDVYAFFFDQKGLMAGLGLRGGKITPITPDK